MRIYDFEGKKNISGERIREARLKLRLSQSDLAARVQVEGVTMAVSYTHLTLPTILLV